MNITNNPSTIGLNRASQSVNKADERISSGVRLNSAADDAAGLVISDSLSAQNRGQYQAIRNAGDGISLAQTAAGALKSVTEGAQRLRELAVQSANGIYTDEDRALLDQEAQSILQQTQDTLSSANFNDNSLFTGEASLSFQVGPNSGDTIDQNTASDLLNQVEELGIADVSLASQDGANEALEFSDALLASINESAVSFGALENQLSSRAENLQEQAINTAEANSQIRDTDIAKESSERASALIREEIGIAVQAQANRSAGDVLVLLS